MTHHQLTSLSRPNARIRAHPGRLVHQATPVPKDRPGSTACPGSQVLQESTPGRVYPVRKAHQVSTASRVGQAHQASQDSNPKCMERRDLPAQLVHQAAKANPARRARTGGLEGKDRWVA